MEKTATFEISIEKIDARRKNPLLKQYPQQLAPQPAYLCLDPENLKMYADWDGEIGPAVPADVYHGRRLRFWISPYLSGRQVNALLENVRPIARVVAAHYAREWDGSNHVGKVHGAGRTAVDEIERICETEGFRVD